MPVLLRYVLLLALLLPLTGQARDFETWARALSAQRVQANPQLSTWTQYLPVAEQVELDRRLTPVTKAYRQQRVAAARLALKELAGFDRQTLTAQQKTSAAAIEWALRREMDGEAYSDHTFVFNQFWGLHVGLVNFLTNAHPIRNARDVDNYLARLRLVGGQIDSGIAEAKDAARRGFLMPRFITTAVIGQLDRFLADPAEKNPLVTSLQTRMKTLADLSEAEQGATADKARAVVASSVIPAYDRVRELLREQLPRTTDDAGLWRLPDGDRAYREALRRFTTTDFTPEQIHDIGLREVVRLEKAMDGLLRQIGYDEGSVGQRMKRLSADLQPREADPRAALLARYEEILRDAEQRARLLFEHTPKAPVIIKREPPMTEKTAAAHYNSPAKDGSSPGIFWMPLPGPDYRVAEMRSLVYHETVPGHHFQIALQQENDALPDYRRSGLFRAGSAFVEGWALYAEYIAAESGWYEGDARGLLGQMDLELWRAKRLVVDTGLHAMRWTRQQAIDYGITPSEVDRYVSIPGQACSYKIGMLRILELRTRAQQALGGKFSLKKFHTLVLQTGDVPLAVLEQVVNDWVADQAKG